MYKQDVLDHFGGVVKTAQAVGVTKGTVSAWPELVPELRAIKIEKISRKKLKYDESLYFKKAS